MVDKPECARCGCELPSLLESRDNLVPPIPHPRQKEIDAGEHSYPRVCEECFDNALEVCRLWWLVGKRKL